MLIYRPTVKQTSTFQIIVNIKEYLSPPNNSILYLQLLDHNKFTGLFIQLPIMHTTDDLSERIRWMK